MPPVKYWEIIGRKLTAAGLDLGAIAARLRATSGAGRLTPIGGDGRRYIVQSDELLTVFWNCKQRCRNCSGNSARRMTMYLSYTDRQNNLKRVGVLSRSPVRAF